MKQFRGCSKLYYAIVTEGTDATTYGTPKVLAPVKAVSRDISSDNEEVWADNILQDKTFAGSKVTRSFDVMRIDPSVEAELLGNTEVTIGTTTKKAYATNPTADSRPYIAVGYALHDGNPDLPCELVWAFRGKVNSITKTSNTIDGGTGSEGQTVEIEFVSPTRTFNETGKRDLDISYASPTLEETEAWFEQVVTADNIDTVITD